jgi:hypothetical protein
MRLDIMLRGDKPGTTPENQLNKIYLTILENSVYQDYMEQEKKALYNILEEILGSIVILSSPLSADALATLLYRPKQDVDQALEDLHSIPDIPNNRTRPLRLHHPSFCDFLLWVDEGRAHRMLADNYVRLMSSSLKRDACGKEGRE